MNHNNITSRNRISSPVATEEIIEAFRVCFTDTENTRGTRISLGDKNADDARSRFY